MAKYFLGLFLVITMAGCKKKDDPAPPTVVIDKIRAALSSSVVAYDNAAADGWINVTAAEYNNLLTIVTGAARYAAPEIYMTTSVTGGWSANYTIGGSDKVSKVPAANYIIGWSVRTGSGVSSALNSKLKISASQKSGYTDYGSPLPNTGSIASNTRVYFVLKTPGTATPASPSYTAIYNSAVYFTGNTTAPSSGPEYYSVNDSPAPSTAFSSDSYFQVISTPAKQW